MKREAIFTTRPAARALAAAALLLCGAARADTILLESGGIVQGRIVAEDDDAYTLEVAGGSIRLRKSDVKSVEGGGRAPGARAAAAASPPWGAAGEWRKTDNPAFDSWTASVPGDVLEYRVRPGDRRDLWTMMAPQDGLLTVTVEEAAGTPEAQRQTISPDLEAIRARGWPPEGFDTDGVETVTVAAGTFDCEVIAAAGPPPRRQWINRSPTLVPLGGVVKEEIGEGGREGGRELAAVTLALRSAPGAPAPGTRAPEAPSENLFAESIAATAAGDWVLYEGDSDAAGAGWTLRMFAEAATPDGVDVVREMVFPEAPPGEERLQKTRQRLALEEVRKRPFPPDGAAYLGDETLRIGNRQVVCAVYGDPAGRTGRYWYARDGAVPLGALVKRETRGLKQVLKDWGHGREP
jgi:hypothetical protein